MSLIKASSIQFNSKKKCTFICQMNIVWCERCHILYVRLHRFIRRVIFCKLFTVCYKFTRLIVGKLTIKLKKQTKDNVGIYATAGVKLSIWIRASPKIHNKSIRLYPPNEKITWNHSKNRPRDRALRGH